ncbi:hypothetical protein HMPREF1487_07843 [Pseudomonas sp. HPB0071]|uniref:Uncharacterized protein n=2 Tax=Pseudomonas TaxID=286 RepID=A0A2X2CFM9_PSELU|nr:hypothetical protein HMPREF1487_07843 [Pseudomonas sp. HPB0071]SEQ51673.1 hypothetical protein SAMN05216409_106126 [Pseudomonas lutea]SHI72501.1 hypothetical protein SAMN05216295_103124 [Pseudomonas zeshuii]SPZ05923.1 Uncharacterised protein [Pseudomonas luteola]
MLREPTPKWRQASLVLIITTIVLVLPNLTRLLGG